LQQNLDANQIEPVRHELLDLLRQVEEIGRSGRSVAGVVEQVRAKLDDMEVRINATRNLAGNRLGELQDRLAFLAERLGDMEGEVPGFDALRENQSAILERFDRMEGLVHRLSPPEEILDRVEGLRRQLQTLPSQREIVRIEEHLVELAGRLETLPADLSHAPLLERIDGQLRSIAAELAETRKHGESGVSDVRQRLVELHDGLQEVAESGRTPDLTGLDEKLSDIASRLEVDRRFSGETLAGLDKRLAALTAAVENQEGAAAAELLAGLNSKIDVLSEAMDANGPRGSRRELEGL
jgi:DNA repair exonuclease SbcCD ATPase subunit